MSFFRVDGLEDATRRRAATAEAPSHPGLLSPHAAARVPHAAVYAKGGNGAAHERDFARF